MPDETAETILLATFPKEVAAADVRDPRARRMVQLLESGEYGGAWLTAIRASEDHCSHALLVDVEVALGQRTPVNDIRDRERIAISFTEKLSIPNTYPLRADFPQELPHFNLTPAGVPRSLCLYDVMPVDAARIYTGLTYLERIRWWLRESAHGRLHDVDQPLDPLFGRSPYRVLLPPGAFNADNQLFFGGVASSQSGAPIVLEALTVAPGQAATDRTVATIKVVTQPVVQGRIHMLPNTLEELATTYARLGVDLVPLITQALRDLYNQTGVALMNSKLLLIVMTPLSRDGGEPEAVATKGFLTTSSVRQVAVSVGTLLDAEGVIAPPLVSQSPKELASIPVLAAELHHGFDRNMAVRTSGTPALDVSVVLIGAGALGSQLALNAARGGVRKLTIIDDDFLLPHNLARHGLGREYLGWSKAEALANAVAGLVGPDEITVEVSAAPGTVAPEGWSELLDNRDLIVDASASLDVPRWLARDQARSGRAASCFVNPAGTDAVVLLESADRHIRLDELEMSYYWLVSSEPALQGHLDLEGGTVRLGGCRHPSVVMPNTRVSALAALSAARLLQSNLPEHAEIMMWRLNPVTGSVIPFASQVSPYCNAIAGGWTVSVNAGVFERMEEARAAAGQLETGGVLVGHWDRKRKILYVVGCYDPPPDSVRTPTGFVRGSIGVFRSIEDLERGTAGNLTYIGEWHTHPPTIASRPSSEDAKVLRWTFEALRWSDAPGLIAICGEEGHRLILTEDGHQQDAAFFHHSNQQVDRMRNAPHRST